MDFARLVEVFEAHEVTFVSVTQSFNTTTSMGRLTLNVLLSFAQFEREVIGERIRDKFAASRARGMWMGGWAPLGYDVKDRKLVVNEAEAALVRRDLRALRAARLGDEAGCRARQGGRAEQARQADRQGVALQAAATTGSTSARRCTRGRAIPASTRRSSRPTSGTRCTPSWARAPASGPSSTRAQTPALLKGLIFGPTGHAMAPTHTRKAGRLYRYYVSTAVLKQGRDACPVGRVPAGEIEAAVIEQVRRLLTTPEIIVRTWRAAREQDGTISEGEVRAALHDLDPLWDELFPAEQARIVQLLVERVDVGEDGHRHPAADGGADEPRPGPQGRHAGEAGGMSTGAEVACDGQSVTVQVPLTFRRRGGRKQVVAPEGWPGPALAPRPARVDGTLVKALARAHRWQGMLESGEYGSIEELARAERINPSYLARVLRLTLLAPEIVESILDGRHDPETDHAGAADEAVPGGMGRPATELLTGRSTPKTSQKTWGPASTAGPSNLAGAFPQSTKDQQDIQVSLPGISLDMLNLSRLALASSSMGRLERVLDEVGGDLPAHVLADFQRVPEVNAAPDAHVVMLGSHLRERPKLPLQLRIHEIRHRERDRRVGPEHRLHDADRHAGHDGRLRGILRVHRRRVLRRPAGIALGRLVAVLVAVADRGDRPPEVVGELRIPIGDEGVGDAHVEQREQARVVGEPQLLRG